MKDLTNSADQTAIAPRCPRCGHELPNGVTDALCPVCLLGAGLSTSPETSQDGPHRHDAGQPIAGELFGHYQIVRLLGQGGMGTVFEAEDKDSGRRVALKLLSQTLDSPEARHRFFREGRLAASINHPNSVYVFGTEEINGIPVIAMELVPGGTLQERVSRNGPWPVGKAVDAVLEMIAGLAAAQEIGILHRDIKPSNGYIDADGHVKIGDYGLSISTTFRQESSLTAAGCFMGTPAFSSPEQLRGDELTVRSDIYALGVTLYYLLTGRHPFAGNSMVQLIAAVLERPAESPATIRPELPEGLCQVVLRCLAKNPQNRPANYPELRAILEPFASRTPRPAPLRLRFLAGLIDSIVLTFPEQLFLMLLLGNVLTGPGGGVWPLLLVVGNLTLALLYYGCFEGWRGAALGKTLCGLRLIRANGDRPGPGRAALRAVVFCGVSLLPTLIAWPLGHARLPSTNGDAWSALFGLASFALKASLFVTARLANGWSAVHDFLSGTRVVLRAVEPDRAARVVTLEPPPSDTALPDIGPYRILEQLETPSGAALFVGFDPRLLRRVWVRRLGSDSPATSGVRRQLGRPGRLRWLAGRRDPSEAWDAYAALSGQPLTRFLQQPVSWGAVRLWLLDLAEELETAAAEKTVPVELGLDRVWITAEGRAVLLDFPGPGSLPTAPVTNAQQLLWQVGWCSLAGTLDVGDSAGSAPPVPMALHARRFMESLKSLPSVTGVIDELRALISRPAEVTLPRRCALTFSCAVFPVLVLAVGWIGWFAVQESYKKHPELAPLRECLSHLTSSQTRRHGGEVPASALEAYIVGRFAATIKDPAVWDSLAVRMSIPADQRLVAERLVTRTRLPSAEEFEKATDEVEAFFGGTPDEAAAGAMRVLNWTMLTLVLGYGNTLLFVVIPALLCSLAFRGGLIVHLLAVAFVRADGRLAGRVRVFGRVFLAWLPFILLPMVPFLSRRWMNMDLATALGIGLVMALAVWSVLRPRRSPQDWLAGVFPVPK